MQKRGQVTVFIIVGIIILAVFIFLFMLGTGSLKSGFDREFQKAVIPEQLSPVKTYIDDCLELKSRTVINTLSSRGGYLEIPQDILPRSVNNPFSNSLEIVPGMETAYWFYESANGIQKEQIPNKEDMEFVIANYLDESFSFEQIQPGLPKTGKVVFDVPKNLKGMLGISSDSMWSDEVKYVSWNKKE